MKEKNLEKICDKIEKVIDKNEISYLFIGSDRDGTIEVVSGDDRDEICAAMFYTIMASDNMKLSKKLIDMSIDVLLGVMDTDTPMSDYVRGHFLAYFNKSNNEGMN